MAESQGLQSYLGYDNILYTFYGLDLVEVQGLSNDLNLSSESNLPKGVLSSAK